MNVERHLLIKRCHYNIDSKISLQKKAYQRKSLADISYTVLECYLQENWAQDANWINIMLTFSGEIYRRSSSPPPPPPPIRNSMLVDQDGSVSYMSSGFV